MIGINLKMSGIGAALLVSLAGCAATTVTPPVDHSTPTPNSETLDQLQTRFNQIADAPDPGPGIESGIAPDNGQASFTGRVIGGNLDTTGDGVFADMAMNVDFDAATVSGNVTNVNVYTESTDAIDSQLLEGSLAISGSITDYLDPDTGSTNYSGIDASLTGNLTGSVDGDSASFNADLGMIGVFGVAGGGTDPNIVAGTVSGNVVVSSDAAGEIATFNFPTLDSVDGPEMFFYGCTSDCATLLGVPGL